MIWVLLRQVRREQLRWHLEQLKENIRWLHAERAALRRMARRKRRKARKGKR